MSSIMWYQSKEMWIVIVGIVNYILNQFGLPSFDPTPEFYGALLVIVGAIRLWFTKKPIARAFIKK